jgi:hypothetical protein
VPVLDTQVAWLRAWLVGDKIPDLTEADKDHWNELATLVITLFYYIANKWWDGFHGDLAKVITLVADCRTQSDWHADKLDPATAERLLLEAVRDDEEVDDVDPPTRAVTYVLLTVQMLKRWNMTDPERVDRLLGNIRARADKELAKRAARQTGKAVS